MFAKQFVIGWAALLASAAVHAQSCSGGAGGGMDATGNDCDPDARWTAALEAGCTPPTPVGPAEAVCTRLAALGEYDKGHYGEAARQLRHAAELGDAPAAETLANMYRVGERLYGDQIRADAVQAARFSAMASALRRASVITSSPSGR